MRYIPNSPQVREEMLRDIGLSAIEDLLEPVPADLRCRQSLNLPPPLSEKALLDCLRELCRGNASALSHACFLGAGCYRHFIPAVVPALVSRGEFLTAYTPYQPEISQGTLQAMYEFQSFICFLTGMEVSNASLYDGASAVAEAVLMANRLTGRDRVLVPGSLHPEYREVIATYTRYLGFEMISVPFEAETGQVKADAVEQLCDERVSALVIQSPNFFGVLEETAVLGEIVHRAGGLLITAFTEPFSLGFLRTPGSQGADIVAGEGQAFGNPVSFGGPALGILAARRTYVRNMPGRIVGRTEDARGDRGFVLTLSTREQHIRRQRATSNICSNEGLCALAATIFLSALGRQGIRDVARQNVSKAHWLFKRILSLPGYRSLFRGPFFNEFAVAGPEPPARLRRRLYRAGILGGLDLGRWYQELSGGLLFCVTENNTQEEMERLLAVLGGN